MNNARYWAKFTAGWVVLRRQQKNPKRFRLVAAVSATRSRLYDSRRRLATLGAGALVLVMGYGVVFGHNGVTVFLHKREETRDLQHQMQQLQTENARLHDHVDQLQNDPAAIEHQAREDLHYTRAGEVIYTLPGPAPAGSQTPASH